MKLMICAQLIFRVSVAPPSLVLQTVSFPRLVLLKDEKNAKPQLAKHLHSQLRNESYHHGHFPIMPQDLCVWFVVIAHMRKEKLIVSICCWQCFLMKERQKYCQGKMRLQRPFRREGVADKNKNGEVGMPWRSCVLLDWACVWNSSEMRLFA